MPRTTKTFTFALATLVAMTAQANAQSAEGVATGRIEGSVLLLPTLSTRKPAIRLYSTYGASTAGVRDSVRPYEFRNVVVYLDSVGSTALPATTPSERLTINQVKEAFAPHVLTVRQGSTVEFLNSDHVFHNVFSLSKAQSFDLGRYPRGVSKSVRFDKPGIVHVFCHIHSDMSGSCRWYPISSSSRRMTPAGFPSTAYPLACTGLLAGMSGLGR